MAGCRIDPLGLAAITARFGLRADEFASALAGPFSFATLERMTRTELLHAALKKLTEAVKLLDNSGEELLADDALELAERVNLSICTGG